MDGEKDEPRYIEAASTIAMMPALIALGNRSHDSMTAVRSGSYLQVSVGIGWETEEVAIRKSLWQDCLRDPFR
jgi:hypothetical protein